MKDTEQESNRTSLFSDQIIKEESQASIPEIEDKCLDGTLQGQSAMAKIVECLTNGHDWKFTSAVLNDIPNKRTVMEYVCSRCHRQTRQLL